MKIGDLSIIRYELYNAHGETEDYIHDYNAKLNSNEMQRPVSFAVGKQTVNVNYLLRTRLALSKILDFLDNLNISGISVEEDKKK